MFIPVSTPGLPQGLYLVATPIGNLQDITLRALNVLASVDRVACEDTRVTGKLLRHYSLKKPLLSYRDHNEEKQTAVLMELLRKGERIALVSDAGTPLVSDPGFRLVKACRDKNVAVFSVPGPSSVMAALAQSGLPPLPFTFHGFLPPKQAARQKALKAISGETATHVFFESAKRLVSTLEDIAALDPQAEISVARELTKIYEETRTGSPAEILTHYKKHPPRGEIVLLIHPSEKTGAGDWEEDLKKALAGQSLKKAVDEVASRHNVPRRSVYQRALEIKNGDENEQ